MGPRVSGPLARRASLLALGAFAVHQLRYAIAYGDGASEELARQGHSYLGDLAPTLAALALSVLFARLLAARIGRLEPDVPASRGIARQGLWFAAALVGIFCLQEVTEGALSAGHPAGIAAVVAGGGLIAVPLALAVGFLAACVDRFLSGAERTLAHAARRRVRQPWPAPSAVPRTAPLVALATRCLAFGLARRPPPGLLSA